MTNSDPRLNSLLYSMTSGVPHSNAGSRYEAAGDGKTLLPKQVQFGTDSALPACFCMNYGASVLVQWIPWPTGRSGIGEA